MANPKKALQRKAYMRDYMRKYRQKQKEALEILKRELPSAYEQIFGKFNNRDR